MVTTTADVSTVPIDVAPAGRQLIISRSSKRLREWTKQAQQTEASSFHDPPAQPRFENLDPNTAFPAYCASAAENRHEIGGVEEI
ncbi:MAG: hypothetical protein NTNFB02_09650 [Nitrospira sp.]